MPNLWGDRSVADNKFHSYSPVTHGVTPTIITHRCPLFREGLKQFLDDSTFTVVASTADLKDVRLSRPLSDSPLLILLVASGCLDEDVAALRLARAQFPHGTTVLLCRDCESHRAAVMFGAGVGAILLVPSRREGFTEALELVMLGQHVVPPHLMTSCVGSDEAEEVVTHLRPEASVKLGTRLSGLSIREVEIVQCLLVGEPNRVIAQRLMISEATVKVHVKAILRKIKVKNRTQAAIWAVSNMNVGYGLASNGTRPQFSAQI